MEEKNEKVDNKVEEKEGQVDEMGGFNIETHLKIFDPLRGEIFLDRRD